MAKKQKTVKSKIPGHKDPVRYSVILKYESEFHKNFTFVSKSIIQEIRKELKSS